MLEAEDNRPTVELAKFAFIVAHVGNDAGEAVPEEKREKLLMRTNEMGHLLTGISTLEGIYMLSKLLTQVLEQHITAMHLQGVENGPAN